MQNRITKPGDYRTRNGSRVTIHEITDKGTFTVKGSVWKMFRGKLRPRGYNIWKPCGHVLAVGSHALDIVAEWGVITHQNLADDCQCDKMALAS